ncbi:hypothetical protein [Pseudomonas putida]|uniref:hypothetical protein n=1 Tax=Pseudomonas putida TaxID=303 RepID=UPI0002D6E775|nr:hypothetical protein [Pseudomonas putida]QQE86465.1 hypothetical protein JET17_12610 [Pseudomonas putida]UTL83488.1 hypothetical protein NL778_11980 [Pseudomonas putida]HEN8712674.1 hypothetical protein [Pseudomonas putida]HEN8717794.1 hypothetical protein [Pseudomonas putida]
MTGSVLVCAAHPTQAQGFWPGVVQSNENTSNGLQATKEVVDRVLPEKCDELPINAGA